jgi:hypothetical protein
MNTTLFFRTLSRMTAQKNLETLRISCKCLFQLTPQQRITIEEILYGVIPTNKTPKRKVKGYVIPS